MAARDPTLIHPRGVAPAHLLLEVGPVAVRVYDGLVAAWALCGSLKPPFYTWWWVREGRIDLRWAGARRVLGEGDWVLFPKNWGRSYRITDGTRLISISFELTWPDGRAALEMDTPLEGAGDANLLTLAEQAARAHADSRSGLTEPLQRRTFPLAAWLKARGTLHFFAAKLLARAEAAGAQLTCPEPVDSRLRQITGELMLTLGVGPLPYAKWARERGLSRGQVDRLARLHLGMTLRAWRDEQLAREVRRRLKSAGESLKELAASLGFVDQAHFTHWVRRRLGAPPSHWRREWLV